MSCLSPVCYFAVLTCLAYHLSVTVTSNLLERVALVEGLDQTSPMYTLPDKKECNNPYITIRYSPFLMILSLTLASKFTS